MQAKAVILEGPERISLGDVNVTAPTDGEVVVSVRHSGISTGTEKLLWSGEMPEFPGMGYPLVPGYEATGEVVETCGNTPFRPGEQVFVPGANCYGDIRGLFGASSNLIVAPANRLVKNPCEVSEEGALLALAATALHALSGHALPDLIVGHGVLGRLLARSVIALGGPPPMVWEKNPIRQAGTQAYPIESPDADRRHDYRTILDASGNAGMIDTLIRRLAKGGELVLAGFYSDRPSFDFPAAFMKEATLRISAEWAPDDLMKARDLVATGKLDLTGLISHRMPAARAAEAYKTAFNDPHCLKMIIDWESAA